MRAASRILVTVVAALCAVVLSTAAVLAKGEGGIIRLAAPIPRDAEPGSTLTVEFSAQLPGEHGLVPVIGSPMVLRLIGEDGGSTEALGTQTETPGTYRVTITVPAGGIDRAIFGLRGTSVSADGTKSIADIPFEVDGVLLAMSDPNPAAPIAEPPVAPPQAATPAPAPSTDLRPAALVALAAAGAIWLVLRSRPRRTEA